jgi:hypothetical protein
MNCPRWRSCSEDASPYILRCEVRASVNSATGHLRRACHGSSTECDRLPQLVKPGRPSGVSCVAFRVFVSFIFFFFDRFPRNETPIAVMRMSTILTFHSPHQQKSQSNCSHQRPFDTLTNLAALLSSVRGLQIHTTEDLRRAILILDLANMCIQSLVRQIGSGTARERLLAQSARIDQLIEAARGEAAHL